MNWIVIAGILVFSFYMSLMVVIAAFTMHRVYQLNKTMTGVKRQLSKLVKKFNLTQVD